MKKIINLGALIGIFLFHRVCLDAASYDSRHFGAILRNLLHNLRTIPHQV